MTGPQLVRPADDPDDDTALVRGSAMSDFGGRLAQLGSRRPVMNTRAPSAANRFAVPRPIPALPPVITATLPSSFLLIEISSAALMPLGPTKSYSAAE
jgi:hypothetical protein